MRIGSHNARSNASHGARKCLHACMRNERCWQSQADQVNTRRVRNDDNWSLETTREGQLVRGNATRLTYEVVAHSMQSHAVLEILQESNTFSHSCVNKRHQSDVYIMP